MKTIGDFNNAPYGSVKLEFYPYNDIEYKPGKSLKSLTWLKRDEHGKLTEESMKNIKEFMVDFQKNNPEEYEKIRQSSMSDIEKDYERQENQGLYDWEIRFARNMANSNRINLKALYNYYFNKGPQNVIGKGNDVWLDFDKPGHVSFESQLTIRKFLDEIAAKYPSRYDAIKQNMLRQNPKEQEFFNSVGKEYNPQKWWYNKGAEFFSKSEVVDEAAAHVISKMPDKYNKGFFMSSDPTVKEELEKLNKKLAEDKPPEQTEGETDERYKRRFEQWREDKQRKIENYLNAQQMIRKRLGKNYEAPLLEDGDWMKTVGKAWIDEDEDALRLLNANGITSFQDIEDRKKAIYDSLLYNNDAQADINSLSNQFMLADKETFARGILEPTQRIKQSRMAKGIKTKGGWELANQIIQARRQNQDIDKQIAAAEARHALKQLDNTYNGSKARLDNFIVSFIPKKERIDTEMKADNAIADKTAQTRGLALGEFYARLHDKKFLDYNHFNEWFSNRGFKLSIDPKTKKSIFSIAHHKGNPSAFKEAKPIINAIMDDYTKYINEHNLKPTDDVFMGTETGTRMSYANSEESYQDKDRRIEETYLAPLTEEFLDTPFAQRLASRRIGRLKHNFFTNFNATAAYLDGVVSGTKSNELIHLNDKYIKSIPNLINKYGNDYGALAAQGRADKEASKKHDIENFNKWTEKWKRSRVKYPGLTDKFSPWVSRMMDIDDDDEVKRRWDRKWRKTLAIDTKNKYKLDTINLNQFPDDFNTLNPIKHEGKDMYAGKIRYSNGEVRYFVEIPGEDYRLAINTKYGNSAAPATYQNEKIKSFKFGKTVAPGRHVPQDEQQRAVQQQRIAQSQNIANKAAESAPVPNPQPVPKQQNPNPLNEVYANTQNQVQKISQENPP